MENNNIKERKYHWTDDDVVTIIDKEFLEEELSNRDSELVTVDGKLDDEMFGLLHREILENIIWFLSDCYDAVEKRVEREKRNINAEKKNHHFKVFWRYVEIYGGKYKHIKTYKNLDDARDFINDGIYCGVDDEFKIVEIKDGVEIKTIRYCLRNGNTLGEYKNYACSS